MVKFVQFLAEWFVQFLAAQIKSSFNWKELQYLGTETLALSKLGVSKVTRASWKFCVKIRCFLHQISFFEINGVKNSVFCHRFSVKATASDVLSSEAVNFWWTYPFNRRLRSVYLQLSTSIIRILNPEKRPWKFTALAVASFPARWTCWGASRIQEFVQAEYQGQFLLHAGILETVREMCHYG